MCVGAYSQKLGSLRKLEECSEEEPLTNWSLIESTSRRSVFRRCSHYWNSPNGNNGVPISI